MAYSLQDNIAQSSIGFQLYHWNATTSKFEYLVPVTSDPPALGSAPSTIETTEADSPVRTYVSDRPDQPSIELEYNFDENANNYNAVKSVISATDAKVFLMLLPLGSAFAVKGTGATWLAGGNPVHGAFSIAQATEAVCISKLNTALTAGEQELLKALIGDDGTIITSTKKLADLIDFTTVPAGRANHEEA